LSSRSASAREPVTYRAPVDGPITDHFRPPADEYGPGNRGVDYQTANGAPVRAAAGGEVVFAGAVGNSLHVVVLHADGIRTSYSFLRSVAVARGNRVEAGATVGTSATSLHFGARAGDAYIDPEILLAGAQRVHLIPDGTAADAAKPQSEAAERSGLVNLVWGGVKSAGRVAGGGAARLVSTSFDLASALPPVQQVRAAMAGMDRLRVDGIHRPQLPGEDMIRAALETANKLAGREPCTPAGEPPPKPPAGERHIAVLVGGLGSSSGKASVLDVDTAALGYRPEDAVQYSYRGGTADENPYTAEDTLADLRQSGRRLRELLDRLQYERPGTTIDVIAHSQGGLVARSALGDELDPFDPRTPRIGALITLASPHRGADLATVAAWMRHTKNGPVIEKGVGMAGRKHGIDPGAKSIHQMAESSDFLRKLNRRPLPKGVRATSIAARRDVIVPSPRSRLGGAQNVIVTVPGIGNDHSRLPGSDPAQREMALALAGKPPTCESASDIAADALTGHAIDKAEKAAGVGAAAASEGM
jgi:hypothetical protein